MKVRRLQLKDVLEEDAKQARIELAATFFPMKCGDSYYGFLGRRRYYFIDEHIVGSVAVDIEFPGTACEAPALWFPLLYHKNRVYGIVPQTAVSRAKLVEFVEFAPRCVAELPCDIVGPCYYACYAGRVVIIGPDALYSYDLDSRYFSRADAQKYRGDAELFATDAGICLLDHKQLSLTRMAFGGGARRYLLQDAQALGFCDERTVAGMPVSHIQSIQFVVHCERYAIYRVFRHPEDVISFLRQKSAIQTKIQQNPGIFVHKSKDNQAFTGKIGPTTDCDVLFTDCAPARRRCEGEMLLVERTDPRKGIYLQSLRYYEDLRSFYEIGYMCIDLLGLRMYYRAGVIPLFSQSQHVGELVRLVHDSEAFEDVIDELFGVKLNQFNNSSALVDADSHGDLSLSE